MQSSDLIPVTRLLAYWNIAPVVPSREIPDPERTELIVENTHVALDGDRIVGVCSFIQHSPTVAEGASLAVDPAYHRLGIADKLASAIRREMYSRGVRTVRLESDRPESISWLVRHRGYEIVGTTPKRHAFGAPDIDKWTVLHLDLGSLPELRDLHAD
jgi:N-acetylglutamate synthase-like GNAT family acetyltransferase